jgi:hypothetical protein
VDGWRFLHNETMDKDHQDSDHESDQDHLGNTQMRRASPHVFGLPLFLVTLVENGIAHAGAGKNMLYNRMVVIANLFPVWRPFPLVCSAARAATA